MSIGKFLKRIVSRIILFFTQSVSESEAERLEKQIDNKLPAYTECRNCGTRLEGMYCHKCGQYASEQTGLMKDFVSEYLSNTYPIDTKIIPTIKQLIRRPGYITNEFLSGKHNSYVHPLKLNLFLLFVVLTILVFFSAPEKFDMKVGDALSNDVIMSTMALQEIIEDSEYSEQLKASPRDTVTILFSSSTAKLIADYMTVLDSRISTDEFSYDTLLVSISSKFIEDGLIVPVEGDIYAMSQGIEMQEVKDDIDLVLKIWSKMTELIITYLPLLILLTCPLMTLVIRLFNLRKKRDYMRCFVFSLHYTAFLEIYMFVIYIFTKIFSLPGGYILLLLTLILTTLYMTFAVNRVFADKNIVISGVKALMMNTFYSLILFLVFVIMFVVSIVIIYAIGGY